MTDKNDNKQDLSFKEQILRDLENIKKVPKETSTDDLFGAKVGHQTKGEADLTTSETALESNDSEPENPTVVYPTIEEMLALQAQLDAVQAELEGEDEPQDSNQASESTDTKTASTEQGNQENKIDSETTKAAISVHYAQKASASEDYVASPVSKNPAVKVPHSEVLEEAAKKKAQKAINQKHSDYVRSTRQVKKKDKIGLLDALLALFWSSFCWF
ncbi:hypothetical protein STRDD10_01455 [Streptococcus sp. DD10]|nr:hypothetical protein [Streptococcus sp. DD10]KXT73536.1 hypothetical protein STRDD10_01455 [Streptococcus sp. DD10]